MPRSQDGPTPVGDERFDALVDLLVGTGEFHAGKMFGARGLKRTSGKFFVAQIDDYQSSSCLQVSMPRRWRWRVRWCLSRWKGVR